MNRLADFRFRSRLAFTLRERQEDVFAYYLPLATASPLYTCRTGELAARMVDHATQVLVEAQTAHELAASLVGPH